MFSILSLSTFYLIQNLYANVTHQTGQNNLKILSLEHCPLMSFNRCSAVHSQWFLQYLQHVHLSVPL